MRWYKTSEFYLLVFFITVMTLCIFAISNGIAKDNAKCAPDSHLTNVPQHFVVVCADKDGKAYMKELK